MLLRARIVLPISTPAIENGVVRVEDNRVRAVGRWGELVPNSGEEVVDLGDCVLMPGLINAHCHLDYTDMAGQIAAPKSFPDWIKAIVAMKAGWGYSDFARSWANGAKMLLRSGVTTVLDIEAVPELMPEVWSVTPLRVVSFREIISLKKSMENDFQLAQAAAQWAALRHPSGIVGLSPHAPYTTHADLLRWAARTAETREWLLTTHVAESREEFEMFRSASGTMYDWLKTQRDMSDCGGRSPVQHLDACGYLSSRLIVAHANYLEQGDAELLSSRGVHVVHCPRSHAYFGHAAFPYEALSKAGMNICLGTDSLASIKQERGRPLELDLMAEARAFADAHTEVAPEVILRMMTVNAARAIGQGGELGEIAPNAFADLVALKFEGPVADAAEAVVHSKCEITNVMINGTVVQTRA